MAKPHNLILANIVPLTLVPLSESCQPIAVFIINDQILPIIREIQKNYLFQKKQINLNVLKLQANLVPLQEMLQNDDALDLSSCGLT